MLLKITSNFAELYSRLLVISFALLLLFPSFSFYVPNSVVAQTSETTSSPPQATGLPTIQITSVQDGQQVPPGELTIQGISSDDEADCQVYADVNDVTPMRNVTAAGPNDEDNNFSQWTFTYTQDYQLIKLGENELTAKISCSDNGEFDLNPFPAAGAQTTSSGSPLSEWHTVNVTGIVGDPSAPLPLPLSGDTEGSEEDSGESNSDESNDNDDDGDSDDEEDGGNGDGDGDGDSNGDGDGNNFFGGDSFFD